MPKVPVTAIRRVVVRDKTAFDALKDQVGDQVELVYESKLGPGNYGALEIPGEYERQLA